SNQTRLWLVTSTEMASQIWRGLVKEGRRGPCSWGMVMEPFRLSKDSLQTVRPEPSPSLLSRAGSTAATSWILRFLTERRSPFVLVAVTEHFNQRYPSASRERTCKPWTSTPMEDWT